MTTKLNEFSQAVAITLKSLHLGVEDLNIEAPKGFWRKVSGLLNTQEIKTDRGREWKLGNCSAFFDRHHKDVVNLLASSESLTNLTEPNRSEQHQFKRNQSYSGKIAKADDKVLPKDSLTQGHLPDAVIEEMRALVWNEIQKILMNRTNLKGSDIKYPMAPQAPLQGKKLSGERVKLSVTIDRVLDDLVKEAGTKLRQPYSQIIDNALWVYFGQPLLSFQKDLDE